MYLHHFTDAREDARPFILPFMVSGVGAAVPIGGEGKHGLPVYRQARVHLKNICTCAIVLDNAVPSSFPVIVSFDCK